MEPRGGGGRGVAAGEDEQLIPGVVTRLVFPPAKYSAAHLKKQPNSKSWPNKLGEISIKFPKEYAKTGRFLQYRYLNKLRFILKFFEKNSKILPTISDTVQLTLNMTSKTF